MLRNGLRILIPDCGYHCILQFVAGQFVLRDKTDMPDLFRKYCNHCLRRYKYFVIPIGGISHWSLVTVGEDGLIIYFNSSLPPLHSEHHIGNLEKNLKRYVLIFPSLLRLLLHFAAL